MLFSLSGLWAHKKYIFHARTLLPTDFLVLRLLTWLFNKYNWRYTEKKNIYIYTLALFLNTKKNSIEMMSSSFRFHGQISLQSSHGVRAVNSRGILGRKWLFQLSPGGRAAARCAWKTLGWTGDRPHLLLIWPFWQGQVPQLQLIVFGWVALLPDFSELTTSAHRSL